MAPNACNVRWAGCVQGVGFRAAVRRAANALGVQGWVTNQQDGSVEALLVGSLPAIDGVVNRIQMKGYSILRCDQTPASVPPEPLGGFEIRQ